jgi:hypothetical protein
LKIIIAESPELQKAGTIVARNNCGAIALHGGTRPVTEVSSEDWHQCSARAWALVAVAIKRES